jgi:hypothetical protein
MNEKFMSDYDTNFRFHLHIGKYSIMMLKPEYYGYLYEVYDLELEKIVGRYESIIKAIDTIKRLSGRNRK